MSTLATDLAGEGDPIKKELREEISNVIRTCASVIPMFRIMLTHINRLSQLKLFIRNESLAKETMKNSISSLEKSLASSEENLKSLSERHEKALKLLARRTLDRDRLRYRILYIDVNVNHLQ
jgi:hypothetical protein